MSRTLIKLCGFTREHDVDAAVAAGADFVGFVLYAKSPRAVAPERALELARRLPAHVRPVLLTVNENAPDLIAALACWAAIFGKNTLENERPVLQFHGDETPQECDAVSQAMGWPHWRAARIPLQENPGAGGSGFDLVKFEAEHSSAQAILLDAHIEGFGGGGQAFDWQLLAAQVQNTPTWSPHTPNAASRHVLGGGLTCANVGEGMALLRPWAVDVSSGIEALAAEGGTQKGIKDAARMKAFVEAVRQGDTALNLTPTQTKAQRST